METLSMQQCRIALAAAYPEAVPAVHEFLSWQPGTVHAAGALQCVPRVPPRGVQSLGLLGVSGKILCQLAASKLLRPRWWSCLCQWFDKAGLVQ